MSREATCIQAAGASDQYHARVVHFEYFDPPKVCISVFKEPHFLGPRLCDDSYPAFDLSKRQFVTRQ